MKKVFFSGLAATVAALTIGLLAAAPASADGGYTSNVVCYGPYASVTLHWTPDPDAVFQWVEISTSSNFTSVLQKKVDGDASSDTWDNLAAGVTHYWRIKYSTASSWEYSSVYSFTPCEGVPLIYYYPHPNACSLYSGYYGYPYYAGYPYGGYPYGYYGAPWYYGYTGYGWYGSYGWYGAPGFSHCAINAFPIPH